LINDILDLAKVDSGKMVFEKIPFKLALSINAMLHVFETKILEKNLTLITDYDERIPVVIEGDPLHLHQVILNLLSNAVKFTPKGSITVSVQLLSEDDRTVKIQFAVRDTGIGIAEDKLEKIFENFQQASSETARLYGGTGLGLAIVKQLIEPQGGSLKVISTPNVGSEFSFILDFNKTDAEAEMDSDQLDLKTDIKDIKVLVAEDIPLNQLLMKTVLEDFGFECDLAGNGKIAVEKMQNKAYDIILMDLQMPVMNGFEATEFIRNKMNSDIPIIALTADVTTVDLAKCKLVGMNDYIAKPVDERVLYAKMIGSINKKINLKNDEADTVEKVKCINLNYLLKRTKSNPELIMQMISLFLEQTPPLVRIMRQSFQVKDWPSLASAVHKMIPSFSIMGISVDYENMAKKVQEFANSQQHTNGIQELVSQIETVCNQACRELEVEYNLIKNKNS
jgi:CheY-like chemotaxis protein